MKRIPSYLRLWIGLLILLALGAGGYAVTTLSYFSESDAATAPGVITVKGHNVTYTHSVTAPAKTVTRKGKKVVLPGKVTTHVTTSFVPGKVVSIGVPVVSTVTGPGGTVTVDRTVTQPVTIPGPTTTVVRSVTGTTTIVQTQTLPGPTTTVTGPPGPPSTITQTVVSTTVITVPGPTTTVTVTVAPPPTT